MKKTAIITLVLLWTTALFAADTVKLKPDTDLVVSASTDTTFTVRSATSTNPSDVGTPVRVYVPVESSYPSQGDYFLYSHSNSPYSYRFNTNTSAHHIVMPFYLNSVGGPKYVKMAVRDGTGTTWKVFNDNQTAFSNEVNTEVQYEISPADFCTQLIGGTDCAQFAPTSTSVGTARSYMTYAFFTTSASLGMGQTIDPANYPGGMYVEINLSNQVNPNIVTSITNVRIGTNRAFLEYSSNQAFTGGKFVLAFERSSVSTTNDLIGSAVGKINARENEYKQISEIPVTDLVNGQSYNYSVFFVDNYNFTTKLSPTALATPKEIEQLLKEQSCFLLTAGFGEEHYIITYFRNFRDTILAKTTLGRAFISVYYEYAPKYALVIYEHEAVRSLIRGAAYTAYFFMTNIVMILIVCALGIISIYLYKNKEKIKV